MPKRPWTRAKIANIGALAKAHKKELSAQLPGLV